ncbi:hypothetical protein Tco_0947807, partial [Tanacetum coccineum]
FKKNKSHNVERAETRETSEPGLIHRLLRSRGRIGAAGLQVKITWATRFLKFSCKEADRFSLGDRKSFLCHKVLGVSVLSFKGDKVLQEVSTSRFWFKEGYLVVKFDRFEQGFHQRVFFDLFVQGFSVRVLLSLRILSTSLLLGFQVSETGLLDFLVFRFVNDKVAAGGYRQVKVLEFFDCPGPRQGVEDLRESSHKGAQRDCEAEVFQVSNDDIAVAQRWLEDKQHEEKTNTNCLRSTQQCMKSGVARHLGVSWIHQQNGLVDETNVTLFAKVTIISDWIQEAYRYVGVFWNMSFNESGEYKKTFIGSGVGSGYQQKDRKPSQNDKTEHGMEKTVQNQGQRDNDCGKRRYGGHSINAVGSQSINGLQRLDISSADMGMLDKFLNEWITDRRRSLKANLQHIEALSTTDARYMTFTKAWKKEIWLKYLGRLNHEHVSVPVVQMALGSLKANLQHIEALSITDARYMTFTKAWKKEIWLK